jgi:hypothetical protein
MAQEIACKRMEAKQAVGDILEHYRKRLATLVPRVRRYRALLAKSQQHRWEAAHDFSAARKHRTQNREPEISFDLCVRCRDGLFGNHTLCCATTGASPFRAFLVVQCARV